MGHLHDFAQNQSLNWCLLCKIKYSRVSPSVHHQQQCSPSAAACRNISQSTRTRLPEKMSVPWLQSPHFGFCADLIPSRVTERITITALHKMMDSDVTWNFTCGCITSSYIRDAHKNTPPEKKKPLPRSVAPRRWMFHFCLNIDAVCSIEWAAMISLDNKSPDFLSSFFLPPEAHIPR